MRVVRTLAEAVGDCVDVLMTTGRPTPGALAPWDAASRLAASPGPAALVFGDEVRGLTNRELRQAGAVSTIPTSSKSSLNLAQAVMVYGYELSKARGAALPRIAPEPLADEQTLSLLRDRTRSLLLSVGFLNPQQPDMVLDELLSLLRRAHPTRRETELLLAAIAQLDRTRVR
jgi:tRNA/rRNA methyltransferase